MKNVTLSMPEDLLKKSREYASKHGTTLNQLIRDLLQRNVAVAKGSSISSLIDHTEKSMVSGKGYQWKREDAY